MILKKRENVKNEYDILYTELESFLNKFNFYYVILKKINLDIWEMQANYNVLSDSSFFCIAINLDLKNDCNYFKSRDNRNYLLYCDNYKFKNVNRKVFKLL